MLSIYFEFWIAFWHHMAEASRGRCEPVKWIVEFGEMQKELEAIHVETGLPGLIAPAKRRIEQRLQHADYDGLSVVFRIDARHGLTQALRGPRHLVLRAQKALSG